MNILSLQTRDDAAAIVRGWLDSKKYWILIPDFPQMVDVIDIETAFYPFEHNDDFEGLMIMIRPAISVIFAAHKRRLSAAQLAKFLAPRLEVEITEADLRERDVLFMANYSTAAKMAESFYQWIQGDKRRRAAKWN